MAPTRHPLIELLYNDETGRYIGMLERKSTTLIVENMRMRCLLGLLTGEVWDDYCFETEDKELFELATDALMRRLQMSEEDARNLVRERWQATNPPEPDPAFARYMVGTVKTAMPHVITHARQIRETTPFDHEKHLAGLEKSEANRERYRETGVTS